MTKSQIDAEIFRIYDELIRAQRIIKNCYEEINIQQAKMKALEAELKKRKGERA